MKAQNIDTIRLNRLSDPKFDFGYSIAADGRANLTCPTTAVCVDLRQAIDFARGHIGEQPRCVCCRFQLNETHRVSSNHSKDQLRYFCPQCKTAFNWREKDPE